MKLEVIKVPGHGYAVRNPQSGAWLDEDGKSWFFHYRYTWCCVPFLWWAKFRAWNFCRRQNHLKVVCTYTTEEP